jgi:integrative and conjugative element protein (TIGR02256 family)
MYERVVVASGAAAAITAHSAGAGGAETGGILIGLVEQQTLAVAYVSPPGPRATKHRLFFRRDTAFLQRLLDRRVRQSPRAIDYVGEWHVHRALDTEPSWVDKRELWRIAASANYAPDRPVLLLLEADEGENRFRAFGFECKPARRYGEIPVDLTP